MRQIHFCLGNITNIRDHRPFCIKAAPYLKPCGVKNIKASTRSNLTLCHLVTRICNPNVTSGHDRRLDGSMNCAMTGTLKKFVNYRQTWS